MLESELPVKQGLYDPAMEHDACGVGFVAHIKGQKSHSIVEQGLLILKNLTHRGAVGADPLMGDGAGVLIQIPDQLYRDDMIAKGVKLPAPGDYGVGMIFLPKETASRKACEEEIERAVRAEGQVVLGKTEPVIRQIFVGAGDNVLVTDALERKLFIIRKRCSHAIRALNLEHCGEFYIPSFSARTVVYKGQLLADQVGVFYRDLADARCVSALALVHQRFSTNTFPTWDLAHPFRMIAHNGEINTMRGNVNWMRAREKSVSSHVLGGDLDKIWPLIYPGQSDSASFDNALELLVMAGYPLAQAVMMMIPEAWEKNATMDPMLKAFYEYHASIMEPWDGPAAVAFTDGRQIGATLDRNGLRPARYLITKDDTVVMASEAGVLPIPESNIRRRWRLEPGKMFLIDLDQGRIIGNEEIKMQLANAKPYGEWIDKIRIRLSDLKGAPAQAPGGVRLHPGRHQAHHDPHGEGRPRAGRLNGQRRVASCALQEEQVALPVFPPALRAGYQSSYRPDPRGHGHVARLLHRTEAQPAQQLQPEPSGKNRGSAAGPEPFPDGHHQEHLREDRRQVQII